MVPGVKASDTDPCGLWSPRSPVNKRCLRSARNGERVSWGDGLEDRQDDQDLADVLR